MQVIEVIHIVLLPLSSQTDTRKISFSHKITWSCHTTVLPAWRCSKDPPPTVKEGDHALWMRTSFLQLLGPLDAICIAARLLASARNATQHVLFILLLSNRAIHGPGGHKTFEASTHTRSQKLMKMMKWWLWSCRTQQDQEKCSDRCSSQPQPGDAPHRVPLLSCPQAIPQLFYV